ncbi:MAG: hypothetical protein LBB90_03855, partial [Tannerella sp.]|nr:hypothetical protein [Tannerella sp.]
MKSKSSYRPERTHRTGGSERISPEGTNTSYRTERMRRTERYGWFSFRIREISMLNTVEITLNIFVIVVVLYLYPGLLSHFLEMFKSISFCGTGHN